MQQSTNAPPLQVMIERACEFQAPSSNIEPELEVRFHTLKHNALEEWNDKIQSVRLTMLDQRRVAEQLMCIGFSRNATKSTMLRMSKPYAPERVSIQGLSNIPLVYPIPDVLGGT